IAHEGKADAGVAGGSLDDHAAGPQPAAFHRILDDEQRRPILDRLAGIHEFGFAKNGAAGLLRCALELDEGGVADRLGDSVANLHDASIWASPRAAFQCKVDPIGETRPPQVVEKMAPTYRAARHISPIADRHWSTFPSCGIFD